jgi:hypothetical protein
LLEAVAWFGDQRHFDRDPGSMAGRAVEREPSAECLDPVDQSDKS